MKKKAKTKRLVIDKGDAERVALRDYFAAMAIQGIIVNNVSEGFILMENQTLKAYEYADAMLAARGKP
jgi:hypothetical protein